jgi:hypothetical protein
MSGLDKFGSVMDISKSISNKPDLKFKRQKMNEIKVIFSIFVPIMVHK